ncbi:NAD-dependent protein deacetylase sirtuin-2 [Mactra antiquata]
MILKLVMAAVRKGQSTALNRVPSAGARLKPKDSGLKTIHPNSSPVYKTQSETSLNAGLSKLSINDNKNKSGPKRNFSSGRNSTNGTVKNISDVASLLQNESVKNVVVVAGAGISTPSGIPDFRSPGTGLYDNLQQYNIPYPEAIFDIDYFFVNPRPFFTLAKELYPSGKYRPNYIHYFVRQLYDKGLLLRMYTQNIDGLERLAGLPEEKLVEAHGTFATATCTTCRQKFTGSDIKEKIFSDKLPRCPTRGCVGIVKPDIVFFGEDLPRKFYSYMKDMLQTDLVLVMGTSLEVQPFAGIIDTVHANVPRVLFNRDAVGPFRYSRRTQDLVSKGLYSSLE